MSEGLDSAQPAADAAGEAEVADRFRDALRLFALRRLRSAADAEDVAQETLARVLAALRERRLANIAALPAFVYETARHVCQQRLRKLGREERAHGRFAAGEETAFEPSALAELLGAERCASAAEALTRLSAEDRELLRGIFYEETPPLELARRMGISDGALRVRKHRALGRLRDLLGSGSRNSPVTIHADWERKGR